MSVSIERYRRAFNFTTDALRTLACESGSMRDRLKRIDFEFYTLIPGDVPEERGLRERFHELHQMVTVKEPREQGEGRITATLEQLSQTKLLRIAELIFRIHAEFSELIYKNG